MVVWVVWWFGWYGGLGGMHVKEIITTNHAQLKSRISRQWFTANLFKKN